MLDVVGHADDETVAFPSDDLGAGELPVHRDDALARAQPSHVRHCHLQKVHLTKSPYREKPRRAFMYIRSLDTEPVAA